MRCQPTSLESLVYESILAQKFCFVKRRFPRFRAGGGDAAWRSRCGQAGVLRIKSIRRFSGVMEGRWQAEAAQQCRCSLRSMVGEDDGGLGIRFQVLFSTLANRASPSLVYRP